MMRPPPRSTLFPYPPLFRSACRGGCPPGSPHGPGDWSQPARSEEHTSELQSLRHLVCRLLLEKNKDLVNKACGLTSGHIGIVWPPAAPSPPGPSPPKPLSRSSPSATLATRPTAFSFLKLPGPPKHPPPPAPAPLPL